MMRSDGYVFWYAIKRACSIALVWFVLLVKDTTKMRPNPGRGSYVSKKGFKGLVFILSTGTYLLNVDVTPYDTRSIFQDEPLI